MNSRGQSDRRAELTERLDVLLVLAEATAKELQQEVAKDGNPAQRRQPLRVVR